MKTRIGPAFPLISRPKLVWRLPRGPFLRVVLALAIFGVPASGQGIITTVAGTDFVFTGEGKAAVGAALGSIGSIALDPSGKVLLGDRNLHLVLRISEGETLSVAAGNSIFNSTGDGGPATSSRLGGPTAMTAGPAGSLYFADTSNHRIRKITPEGIINTAAGTGFRGYSGDGGLAAEAQLSRPAGIAFDPAGNLVFADMGNHVIRAILADSMLARKSWPDQKIQ